MTRWKQPDRKPPTALQTANARRMRRDMTPHEKRLWWHLRHRLGLSGTHFRRQMPIGPYIVDFVCLSARLIVEVDGGQHFTDEAERYDAARTAFLNREGFRLIRFANGDVSQNIDSVLETIRAALPSCTHPELERAS